MQRKVVDKTRNRLSRTSKKINKLEANLGVVCEQLSTEMLEHSRERLVLIKAEKVAGKQMDRANYQLEARKMELGLLRAKLCAANVYNERHDAVMEKSIECSVLDLRGVNLLENGKWSEPGHPTTPYCGLPGQEHWQSHQNLCGCWGSHC